MTVYYIPVFKVACSYSVSVGRRWSIIEHAILVDLISERRTLDALSRRCNLPRRLVIEALTNLLRAGWIEIRASEDGIIFKATATGMLRGQDEDLPTNLHSEQRWMSLCFDCLTGSWMKSDDLDLVYNSDLPDDANILDPTVLTFDPREVPRDLLQLKPDEGLDPVEPGFRTPSRPFARVKVSFGEIEGLPTYASLYLRSQLLDAADASDGPGEALAQGISGDDANETYVGVVNDDIVVGGPEHLALLVGALERARSTVIIHSCFLHPEVIGRLAPHFEKAARRKVRVELLWGLQYDPETPEKRRPITETEKLLAALPATIRARVQLSTVSSRSHAKFVVFDDKDGQWTAVIGSCNWLSSWYDAIDVSIIVRSPFIVSQLLARIISTQQPASGGWPPMTIRLNRLWGQIARHRQGHTEEFSYRVRLVADMEHHACVTQARDEAISSPTPQSIIVGCDLYGISAETSVLTPTGRAAELGNPVSLLFQRPSRYMSEEGRKPDITELDARGLHLTQVDKLHGKFLICGEQSAVITSFNWMSTALDGTRSRNAEFGLKVVGPRIGLMIADKLAALGVRQALPAPVPEQLQLLP